MTRVAVLAGLGTHLPPDVLTNDMLSQLLDTSDEWIRTRTGIRQRHIAAPGVRTSDLAVQAARNALASSGTDHVDAVVLATTTPDMACPGTAPQVAATLGLGGVPAFDISAACTGFIYGLATAAGMVAAGLFDSVLLIGADTFSTTLDPQDRTTRSLIGDGAGAVVLRAGRPGDPGAVLGVDLGSDGAQVDLLTVPAVTALQRGSGEASNYFQMQGRAVFMNAVTRMTESVTTVLKDVGWPVNAIDHLVPHQANARILTAVADQLGLEQTRTVMNIADVGNTVSASIPLALAEGLRTGRIHSGDKVVLTGFGAGLTWGSVALEWPDITAVPTEGAQS